MDNKLKELLEQKTQDVWRETLMLHKRSPETRVASSLSCVEILVAMYYGGILKYDPADPDWEGRDRFIVSKGHGSISLYPILADLGFFPEEELMRIGQAGSFLGSIPDPVIPGYETVNGSLGHGLGVACGMAVGLDRKKSSSQVFVMVGDGELYEGSNWEALMFAGHHGLNNLTLIVDHNKISMLDFCDNIISHGSLAEKFRAFDWKVAEFDGHNIEEAHRHLEAARNDNSSGPIALIAHTVKGKGGGHLENDSLCHIKSLKPEHVDELLEKEERP
ncbi:transketolase [Lentisphaerota bacterium ZTH]|nr:transketolase [Lentisphaerota bacterium]WET05147.1 transketolase [Lentisphaerota bacterium ZTH]